MKKNRFEQLLTILFGSDWGSVKNGTKSVHTKIKKVCTQNEWNAPKNMERSKTTNIKEKFLENQPFKGRKASVFMHTNTRKCSDFCWEMLRNVKVKTHTGSRLLPKKT